MDAIKTILAMLALVRQMTSDKLARSLLDRVKFHVETLAKRVKELESHLVVERQMLDDQRNEYCILLDKCQRIEAEKSDFLGRRLDEEDVRFIVKVTLIGGQKIRAVIFAKRLLGLGLAEAKEYVDRLEPVPVQPVPAQES